MKKGRININLIKCQNSPLYRFSYTLLACFCSFGLLYLYDFFIFFIEFFSQLERFCNNPRTIDEILKFTIKKKENTLITMHQIKTQNTPKIH